jgi:hypothetical protein
MYREAGPLWRSRTVLPLCAALGALCVFAAPAAATPYVWTGVASSGDWSNASNWNPPSPAASGTSLSFPVLSGPCATPTAANTCYYAYNDVAGLSLSGVTVDNNGGQSYGIYGLPITLGAGGLTESGPSLIDALSSWYVPITLSSSQTWSLAGNVDLQQVNGTAYGLTIDVNGYFDLFGTDSEVGTVNLNGSGTLTVVGALNGSDGNAVNIHHPATLSTFASTVLGPLSDVGGTVFLGDSKVGVNGALALRPGSTLETQLEVGGAGKLGYLMVSGDAALGGTLIVNEEATGNCPTAAVGTVYTLVAAAGPVTGTFAGLPNGAVLSASPECHGPAPLLRITYTRNSAILTVVAALSRPRIRALLSRVLKPVGRNASIGRLLKRRGYTFALPPTPGSIEVEWDARSKGRSVLVASGTTAFAGAPALTIGLSRAGRRLLMQAHSIKLSAKAIYIPVDGASSAAHKTFALKR